MVGRRLSGLRCCGAGENDEEKEVKSMTELKPYPFCGGTKLKIDSKRTFQHGGKKHCSVSIRCMKCHARSPVVGINMPNGKYNEREICENAVTEAWNRRVENG